MRDSDSTNPDLDQPAIDGSDPDVPAYEGAIPSPALPEQLGGEYLDDDPDAMWELPPNAWDRARFGDEEAWARQRTRNANRDGELIPQVPVARLDPRRAGRKARQVNFRTTEAGHEELTRAAGVFGVSRAALAAVLVRDGVARILREHGRALRAGPPGRDLR